MAYGVVATLLVGAAGFLLVDALLDIGFAHRLGILVNMRGWLARLGHAAYRDEAAI